MSTIIKGSNPESPGPIAPYRWPEMTDRGGAASGATESMIAQAQREADAIRRQAHDEGLASAMQAAEQVVHEKVSQQLSTLMPALREAVESIEHAKAQWLLQWERAAVRVATAIAGRVVRRQIEQEPQITLTLIREALELAAGSAEIRLHLHPDDVTALGQQVRQVIGELARIGQPQIVSDPQIVRGGCRVETRFGVIDQQFDAQLARIEEELT